LGVDIGLFFDIDFSSHVFFWSLANSGGVGGVKERHLCRERHVFAERRVNLERHLYRERYIFIERYIFRERYICRQGDNECERDMWCR